MVTVGHHEAITKCIHGNKKNKKNKKKKKKKKKKQIYKYIYIYIYIYIIIYIYIYPLYCLHVSTLDTGNQETFCDNV